MRWSFEELFRAIRIYRQSTWRMKIKLFPFFVVRVIKIVFHWLFKGYCRETQYSLDHELLYIINFRLKVFKKQNTNSFPERFGDMESWHVEIQNMINKTDYLLKHLYSLSGSSEEFRIAYISFMDLWERNFMDLWD